MKIFLILFFSSCLYAEETILITADRIKTDISKSSNSIKLIDSSVISNSSEKTLPELLSQNSDIQITNGSIFLRGTDSAHTLVVLDGVLLNDPSHPNRSFNISKLSMTNIKSIEILKGAQGVLYGANAIGGVIVITSKTDATPETRGSGFGSYGTYNTFHVGLDAQKKMSILKFSFGVEHFNTDGFSAANIKSNPKAEPDGEKRTNFNLQTKADFTSRSSLEANLRYTKELLDLDNCGGGGCDDPTSYLNNENILSKIQFNQIWNNDLAETRFTFSRGQFDHFNKSSQFTSHNKGLLDTFAVNHTNYLNDKLTQNINIDFAKESNQLNQANENSSVFVYHKYDLENIFLNMGIKLDYNKLFKEHLSYKLAAAKKLTDNHLIRTSYSTGYQAPGLFQLFDSTYGNKYLTPEKSSSLELGHEWSINSNQLHTNLFFTNVYDRLTYVSALKKTVNSGSSYISGIEQSFKTSFSNSSVTFLKNWQPRRPHLLIKNSFYFFNINLESEYVGPRPDVDKLNNVVVNSAYFISHISYSYKNYFLKIKNIFNTEYEEVYGYGTGGRMLTIGLKSNF